MPYSLRRRRKIVAALKLPRPESVQTEIEERGVSIQKARRKRTHDIDNLAIIHVPSCNDVLALQEMSLAQFHIMYRVGASLHRLHALCIMLHTSYPPIYDNVLASQDVFIAIGCTYRITCLLLRTCLYTSHVHYTVGSLLLANNAMHSPSIYTYIYIYI